MEYAWLLLEIRYFFICIFLLTLWQLLHYRDRARLEIALMFGSVAIIMIVLTMGQERNKFSFFLGMLAVAAQPYLLLRLVQLFRPIPKALHSGCNGVWRAFILLLVSGGAPPPGIVLLTVLYFVVVETYASVAFFQGAFQAVGVTRWRLGLVALGSGLLAMMIFLIGVLTVFPGLLATLVPLGVAIVLLAPISYYLGFIPPRWLQRIWQQGEVNRFLQHLSGQPDAVRISEMPVLLPTYALRAVGGSGAEVARWHSGSQTLKLASSGTSSRGVTFETGITAEAWQTRRPRIARNLTEMGTIEKQLAERYQATTLLAVPIQNTEQTWGVLMVFLLRMPLFLTDDLQLLGLFAEQSALLFAYEAMLNQQQTLVQFAQKLNIHLQLDKLLNTICQETATALQVPVVAVSLYDPAQDTLVYQAGYGQANGFPERVEHWLKDGETPSLTPDTRVMTGLPPHVWHAQTLHTTLNIDMLREAQLIGQLSIGTPVKNREFTPHELALMRGLASQAASAITNARLYEEVAHELGERKRVEEALRKAQELLERKVEERTAEITRSNEELSQFAYVVSHDLRAPLRALRSYSQFLVEDYEKLLGEEGQEFIEGIVENAERMNQLIVDLLEYSRIGRTQVELSAIEVGDLLDRIIRRFEDFPPDTFTLAPDFPTVQCPVIRLEQIFINLLTNALKFQPPGRAPQIGITWADGVRVWQFSVTDNGIGIPAPLQEKIFGIFYRLHTQDEYEGTGIGLAIVKKAVEELGGTVQVHSTPGEGSTFTFTIPK